MSQTAGISCLSSGLVITPAAPVSNLKLFLLKRGAYVSHVSCDFAYYAGGLIPDRQHAGDSSRYA